MIALPTLVPLSVNVDRLARHADGTPRSASPLSVVVPPKVPVAGATARLVALVAAVSMKQTWTLESDGVTEPFVVVRNALYFR